MPFHSAFQTLQHIICTAGQDAKQLQLRKLPTKTIHYIFTETQFESNHDLGESKNSWKAIEQVWRFPEVWLLFYGRNAFFTLPVDAASREALTFIEEQVKRHGGKIK